MIAFLRKELNLGKKVRCRKTYTSKGQRKNVSNENRFDTWDVWDRALFKLKAIASKKRTCKTVPNPDPENTKERFIRVCTSGR